VHRNSTNNGLTVTSGIETATSYKDTYSFSYGMGPISLMIHFNTRIRVHASYGCTIKVNTEFATVTGGGFFHGGVTLEPQLDCQIGSYIDIIPEDGSLLMEGKKRLIWDPICGAETIPLCTPSSPSSPPPDLPRRPDLPRSPPRPPSPPPFPPNPSSPVEDSSGNIGILVGVGGVGVILFGGLSLFVLFYKRNTAQVYKAVNTATKPEALAGSETGVTVHAGGIWTGKRHVVLPENA